MTLRELIRSLNDLKTLKTFQELEDSSVVIDVDNEDWRFVEGVELFVDDKQKTFINILPKDEIS